MLELKRRYYPDPWGRPSEGDVAAVEAITIEEIRDTSNDCSGRTEPSLAVAGQIDWAAAKDLVGELLADWKPISADEAADGERGVRTRHLAHQVESNTKSGCLP